MKQSISPTVIVVVLIIVVLIVAAIGWSIIGKRKGAAAGMPSGPEGVKAMMQQGGHPPGEVPAGGAGSAPAVPGSQMPAAGGTPAPAGGETTPPPAEGGKAPETPPATK